MVRIVITLVLLSFIVLSISCTSVTLPTKLFKTGSELEPPLGCLNGRTEGVDC